MSEVTNTVQTRNQLYSNYDLSKLLLGFNSFTEGDLTSSGADVDLVPGLVMGRIAATAKIVPLDSTATDGSQLPVGVCIVAQTVADGATETIKMVNKGKIAEEKVNFAGAETLATPVGPAQIQKILRDALEDLGLELETTEELTDYDNS